MAITKEKRAEIVLTAIAELPDVYETWKNELRDLVGEGSDYEKVQTLDNARQWVQEKLDFLQAPGKGPTNT